MNWIDYETGGIDKPWNIHLISTAMRVRNEGIGRMRECDGIEYNYSFSNTIFLSFFVSLNLFLSFIFPSQSFPFSLPLPQSFSLDSLSLSHSLTSILSIMLKSDRLSSLYLIIRYSLLAKLSHTFPCSIFLIFPWFLWHLAMISRFFVWFLSDPFSTSLCSIYI